MKETTKTNLIRTIYALWALCLPLYAVKVYLKSGYMDFDVFHRAGSRVLEGKFDEIYNTTLDGASPYRYSPFYLILFEVFAQLSLPAARVSWFILQHVLYSAGFYFIYLLARENRKKALFASALALIFTARFMLDSFTIGQTTGLLFCFSVLGLYAWGTKNSFLFSLSGALGAWLKIGPGILMGMIFQKNQFPFALRSLVGFILWLSALTGLTGLALGFSNIIPLTKAWAEIVLLDSQYFDASHRGSQCIKGALLRLSHLAELYPPEWVTPIWLTVVGLGCLGLVWIWHQMNPKTFLTQGYFFSLSTLAYLLFMPETFKYSMPLLYLPLFFVFLGGVKKKWEKIVLTGFFIFFSAFARDIYGEQITHIYGGLSIPLIFVLLLTVIVVSRCLAEIKGSHGHPAPNHS